MLKPKNVSFKLPQSPSWGTFSRQDAFDLPHPRLKLFKNGNHRPIEKTYNNFWGSPTSIDDSSVTTASPLTKLTSSLRPFQLESRGPDGFRYPQNPVRLGAHSHTA